MNSVKGDGTLMARRLLNSKEFTVLLAFGIYGCGINFAATTVSLSAPSVVTAFKLTTQVISLFLLLISIIGVRYRMGRLVVAGCLVIATLISALITDDFGLVWLALFVLSGEHVTLRGLAKTSILVNAIFVALAGSLAVLGVIENVVYVGDGSIRYCMGFLQPNNFGLRLAEICIGIFIVSFDSYRARDYLCIVILMVICEVTCRSRTSLIIMGSVILLMLFSNLTSRKRSKQRVLAALSFLIFVTVFLASLYFMYCYNPANELHRFLNSVLSKRLFFMRYYAETMPPTLFGQNVDGVITDMGTWTISGFILDNSWAHSLEVNGILVTLGLVLCHVALCVRMAQLEGPNPFPYVMILFSVLGFSEAITLNVFLGYYLLAFSSLLFRRGLGGFLGLPMSARPSVLYGRSPKGTGCKPVGAR